MIRRLLLLLCVMIAFVAGAKARGLDIRLGSEAAQIEYLVDSDSQIGIGGADISGAFFFNEEDDLMAVVGVVITGSSVGSNRALQFGAGARIYVADLDLTIDAGSDPDEITIRAGGEDSVMAAAIGGRISYIFPSSMPMAVTGELFYGPEITSFGDNSNLTDFQIRFEVELAPSTRAYVGYRNLEVEMEDSGVDYELDGSAHVGVRFSF